MTNEKAIEILQEILDRYWKLDQHHIRLDFDKIRAIETAIESLGGEFERR